MLPVVSSETAALKSIYGADINTDPSTPDGQVINIRAQAAVDNLDLLAQINAMFDPDQAIGVLLDQRCAINGVKRKGGTFTLTGGFWHDSSDPLFLPLIDR